METADPEIMRKRLLHANAERAQTDEFDLDGELAVLLAPPGLSPQDSGGTISWDKLDPLMPSRLRLGAASALTLVQQAVVAAAIWRDRTGEGQNIGIDLGQAIRRLAPASEMKWETLNGFPVDKADKTVNRLLSTWPTKDGRHVLPTNVYPGIKSRLLSALGCADDPQSLGAALASHTADELETMGETGGFVMAKVRSVEEFVNEPVFDYLAARPLIEIEKVGESAPEPFDPFAIAPLSGVRALGMGHVIAGAGIGRSLAAHGADVLQLWRLMDWEQDTMLATSNVGARSARLHLRSDSGREQAYALLREADVFFANRRPGLLADLGFDLDTTTGLRPGLIHVTVSTHGEGGPWAHRLGFDQPAGAVSGTLAAEGTLEAPKLPPTKIVNDYLVAWLAATGAMVALRRRATEGGSYRVHVSLTRAAMWLNSLGFFDPDYVEAVVGSGGQHKLINPQLFRSTTPLGVYQGVTDQVIMSRTPTHYTNVLSARGADQPVWLPKPAEFDASTLMRSIYGA